MPTSVRVRGRERPGCVSSFRHIGGITRQAPLRGGGPGAGARGREPGAASKPARNQRGSGGASPRLLSPDAIRGPGISGGPGARAPGCHPFQQETTTWNERLASTPSLSRVTTRTPFTLAPTEVTAIWPVPGPEADSSPSVAT
ncbi:MAG: hypothetical protein QOH58_2337 [Thermoleophilaceae bacterium]|nr:hypothetical protein [Thermoleophilaceae bacterium]